MFSRQLPGVFMCVTGRRGGGPMTCCVCNWGGHSREERFPEHLRAQVQFVIQWISIFFLSLTPFLTISAIHMERARLPLAAETGKFQGSHHCRDSPLADTCIVRAREGLSHQTVLSSFLHIQVSFLCLLSRSLQNLPLTVNFSKQHVVIKSSC